MARSKNNTTASLSGKVDQFVYRQRLGRTVVAKPPLPRNKPITAGQQTVRLSFLKAVAWAKTTLTDAVKKQEYKARAKPGNSAYVTAIKDYLNPPVIHEIDSSRYLGQAGGIISIIAMDDFKVAAVLVRIEKPDGSLVEDGVATASGDGLHWVYSSTIAAGNISGCSIIVTATDMPGNAIVKQKTI